MAKPRGHSNSEQSDNLAAILIDHDNLIGMVGGVDAASPHRLLVDMLTELRRYLSEELRIRPVHSIAYGDFGPSGQWAGNALPAMTRAGVETCHVPGGLQTTDPATSLTLHAIELLHARPNLTAFVILGGDNWYVPLVRHLQRRGKFVLVAALELPQAEDSLPPIIADSFLNAKFLVGADDRDSVTRRRRVSEVTGQLEGSPVTQNRAPKDHGRIENPGAYRALELLEECFGQYEEVYLTPLLRKMSEHLAEDDGVPKDLVNDLQDAGAVWLEKRRGFPHDYTVLMVNDEHPDVADVRAGLESSDDYLDGIASGYEAEMEIEDHE